MSDSKTDSKLPEFGPYEDTDWCISLLKNGHNLIPERIEHIRKALEFYRLCTSLGLDEAKLRAQQKAINSIAAYIKTPGMLIVSPRYADKWGEVLQDFAAVAALKGQTK